MIAPFIRVSLTSNAFHLFCQLHREKTSKLIGAKDANSSPKPGTRMYLCVQCMRGTDFGPPVVVLTYCILQNQKWLTM